MANGKILTHKRGWSLMYLWDRGYRVIGFSLERWNKFDWNERVIGIGPFFYVH